MDITLGTALSNLSATVASTGLMPRYRVEVLRCYSNLLATVIVSEDSEALGVAIYALAMVLQDQAYRGTTPKHLFLTMVVEALQGPRQDIAHNLGVAMRTYPTTCWAPRP